MRIAQVAPLYESVPPILYGGTERIVHALTESLTAEGHDVTLFASGDSKTSARLRAPVARALRLGERGRDPLPPHLLMMEMVLDEAADFDVIHFHTDLIHFPLTRQLPVPSVTTLHGRLDLPQIASYFARYMDHPVVSISDNQRLPLPHANWVATIHHGLDTSRLRFHPHGHDSLAFLGRISREKRFDRAVDIARRTGMKLKVAAKREVHYDADYLREVEPLMNDPCVEFVGEINDADKPKFLGESRALVFPIDWPEPFGLVMIEALACGTPVIAYPNGAVPEIIRHGVNGYIVNSIDEAVTAVEKAHLIDRHICRRDFEERFSMRRMTKEYLNLFERFIGQRQIRGSIRGSVGGSTRVNFELSDGRTN